MLWLVIIALVLLAATWLVVLLVHLSLWIAVGLTALLILIVAGVLLVRFIRARMRAAALERELLRQAAQQADRVRPDRRPEILALQAQMRSAFDALKRSKLGKGGKSALYSLPWYVVIGPPAAGKTTALSQSGLGFITPPGAAGSKLRGTAGTKNCDWWFSQQAILLDTAGRLATEEDDQDEWMTFLETVRRFRPERPLDGVVVAVSAEELLSGSEDQVEDLVTRLRARVDELCSRLDMVLPVYVMVTKVDLVAGFVEFWGDLGKQQRGQAWGASFSLDDERIEDLAGAVEAEFDILAAVLHRHLLERLGREPQPLVRARVLQFPLEFQALRRPVAHFVEALGRPNPYQETPFVRGFYFSSGTQTGRAMDRVLANMARGFDLRALGGSEARAAQAQSFFVTDLFAKVVFPDRHLAVRSQRRVRQRLIKQGAWAGGALVLTLAAVTPATMAYLDNSALISDTRRDVNEALTLERSGAAASAANALNLLLARIERLEKARESTSVTGFLGPYTAADLVGPLDRLYRERLRAMVEGPVQAQLVSDVRAIGDLVRTDLPNFQRSYDDLKLYVMLTNPEHLNQDYATERLASVWARAFRSERPEDRALLSAHARRYIAALAADHGLAWRADATSLARAQGRLAMLPLDEVRFGWLSEAAEGAPPIRPEKIFFGASSQYWLTRGNVEVPGLYTALGWQKVRAVLESPDSRFELEPWVLGQAGANTEKDSREGAIERLKELYFQRYAAAWSDFISGLDVQAPSDMPGALQELRALAEADGPYVRLFRTLSDNVRLDIGPATLTGKLLEKGKQAVEQGLEKLKLADAGAPERAVSSVERKFQPMLRFAFGDSTAGKPDTSPSGLNQYLAYLSTLEVALSQLAETRADPSADFAAELARTAAAVQRLLAGTDPTTRIQLEPLLMNPIRGSRSGVVRADFAALSDKWKAEVWDTFNTKIQTRFPFANTPNEVSVPEFADFFRPDSGALWKFFKQNLESRLERSGNAFVPKAAADPMPFRADFLSCLAVAQEITEAVFGSGPEPNVQFSIKIHPVGSNISEVALIVDGQATVYRNEPERWAPTQWPGKGDPHGGTLQIRGAGFTDEIPRLGDFGLFRLLLAGGIKPSGQVADGIATLSASWPMTRAGEAPVNIDFKPAKTVHPFGRDFFRRLRCPPETTVGGGAAPGAGR